MRGRGDFPVLCSRAVWGGIAASLLILVMQPTPAEAKAWRQLRGNDVERIIETFPAMYAEYKAWGVAVDPKTGQIKGMSKARHDKKVTAALKRHGWGKAYWGKLQAVCRGYALIKHDQFMAETGPRVAKGVEELKRAKWMKQEAKEKLEADVARGKGRLNAMAENWRKKTHPKDVAAIKPHVHELDVMFRNLK